jgi:hypothetical protein
VKYLQKSETLALKKLYQLLGIGYFWILFFGLKLDAAGTSAHSFFLMLFSKKESQAGMKMEAQFFLAKSSKFHLSSSFSCDTK